MSKCLAAMLLCIASPAVSLEAYAADRNPYPAREHWDEYRGRSLNVSVFVFRDTNRDGRYDVGDRPMSGIIVEAVGNRRTVTRRSNLSGFANFRMSATDLEMEITFPGEYAFHTLVPEGWEVTTGNTIQPAVFELMPGSPADLVASTDPNPVGLAPPLTITGTLAAAEALQSASSSGAVGISSLDQEGAFSVAVTPGTWTLTTLPAKVNRTVEIGGHPVLLADGYFSNHERCGTAEERISFDDLLLGGILKVPSGYHDLSWENFVMTHHKFYKPEGYRNNTISGEFLAYNGSGHPVSLYHDEPFDFVGGFFGASTLDAEGETLSITGWRGKEVAYRQTMAVSALGAKQLLAEFRCVTRVDFETLHYWQFTVDDLVVRLPQ